MSDEWMIDNVFECVNMREYNCCTVSEQINETLNFHFMCHRYKNHMYHIYSAICPFFLHFNIESRGDEEVIALWVITPHGIIT